MTDENIRCSKRETSEYGHHFLRTIRPTRHESEVVTYSWVVMSYKSLLKS